MSFIQLTSDEGNPVHVDPTKISAYGAKTFEHRMLSYIIVEGRVIKLQTEINDLIQKIQKTTS